MNPFCLDSNVFIQAKNGPYGFDIAPGFWEFLDQQISKGTIFSSIEVYEELVAGNDVLADWIKVRKHSGGFIDSDADVQSTYREIADFVSKVYADHQVSLFLEKADPWVIALAKVGNAIVVTQETLIIGPHQKIKIPNICKEFGVEYMDTYQMMRILKASLRTD